MPDTRIERPTPSDRRLKVSAQTDWACAWLRVEGALVAATVPHLRRAIEEVWRGSPRKVRLLMSGVAVDDAGAEFLAEADRRAQALGTKLVIRSSGRGARGRDSRYPVGALRPVRLFARRPAVAGAPLSPRADAWWGRPAPAPAPVAPGPPLQSA